MISKAFFNLLLTCNCFLSIIFLNKTALFIKFILEARMAMRTILTPFLSLYLMEKEKASIKYLEYNYLNLAIKIKKIKKINYVGLRV